MENTNISQARKNLFELAERAIDYNSVINISTKKGNVILLSEEEYNGMMETLYLQSVPGMAESIAEGINTPIEECIEIDLKKALGK